MADKIVVLTDVEHALLRAPMYIGSLGIETVERPIIEDGKVVFKKIEYVPALFKLIHELLDNAVDVYAKSSGQYSTKIEIKIDEKSFAVKDNGYGIPVEPAYDSSGNPIPDSWAPLKAWTELKAGSNFDDDISGTQGGQNGMGASLCAVFAKSFIGETDDGKQRMRIETKNNMAEIKYKLLAHKRQGTVVYFEPDFRRFEHQKFEDIYF